jgi:hypothetical protein
VGCLVVRGEVYHGWWYVRGCVAGIWWCVVVTGEVCGYVERAARGLTEGSVTGVWWLLGGNGEGSVRVL